MMNDSLEDGHPSVGSTEMIGIATAPVSSVSASAKKAKKDGEKLVKLTGYILYSSGARKKVATNNPGSSYSDVCCIVGAEWQNLPQETKTAWEEKAAKMNGELTSKFAAAETEANSTAGQSGPNHIVLTSPLPSESTSTLTPKAGSHLYGTRGSAKRKASENVQEMVEVSKVLSKEDVAKKDSKKLVTGYSLHSSDARKQAAANYPESSFGEVSRIIGTEWRNLPQATKTAAKAAKKAAKIKKEMNSKFAAAEAEANSTAGQIGPNDIVPETEMLWECCWDTCDFQFEDIGDCIDHVGSGMDPQGHVHSYFANQPSGETEWQCRWRNCGRIKKGVKPFPNLHRLVRHVKEVHILKSTGRMIPLHDRSKNFVISHKPRAVPLQTAAVTPSQPTLLNQANSTAGQNGPNLIVPTSLHPLKSTLTLTPKAGFHLYETQGSAERKATENVQEMVKVSRDLFEEEVTPLKPPPPKPLNAFETFGNYICQRLQSMDEATARRCEKDLLRVLLDF